MVYPVLTKEPVIQLNRLHELYNYKLEHDGTEQNLAYVHTRTPEPGFFKELS